MMKTLLSRFKSRGALGSLAIMLSVSGLVAEARSAPIPEPETVFFGQVLVRSGGQDYVVMDGDLRWVVSRADGGSLAFATRLEPLAGGAYSYMLKVPHEAASLGLEPSVGAVIPLGSTVANHDHLMITIDGQPATIVVPGGGSFSTGQARRAQTLRLDLRVDFELPDSDGDGIDDWWEDANGLDKQLASDAGLDRDADGLTNLAEFLGGSNPGLDNRAPQLITDALLAYADGTSGVLLQTADTDSAPGEVSFTVSSLPAVGVLELRDPDAAVAVGSTFTQADLDRGRLVYVHRGDEETSHPEIGVVIRDGDPAHPASPGTIGLVVYRPDDTTEVAGSPIGSAEHSLRVRNFLLSRDGGYTIWDFLDAPTAQRLDLSGSVFAHVIVGGVGDDDLAGGDADDIVVGAGGDDMMRGGGGGDTFVVFRPGSGSDTIADFHPEEGDAIDLTLALDGSSSLASDYVQILGARLGVDRDGDGSGFSDMVVSLPGNDFAPGDLRRLIDGGNILLGGLDLPPLVTVEATLANASENDRAAGEFTITRSGSTGLTLVVQLAISGSATNGVDYSLLDSRVVFLPGQRTLSLQVNPFTDSLTEAGEVVEILVVPGAGYVVGRAGSAQVAIADLMPQISLEALEPLAVRNPSSPGAFLVSRSGVLDRSVLVRLRISGTATNGAGYERLSPFLNLAAGQTSGVMAVVPVGAAGDAPGGAESVVLAVNADAAYLVGDPGTAQVIIVDELTDYESFLAGSPAGADSLADYAFQSRGGFPRPGRNGRFLQIEFDRNWSAGDLEYIVEVSSDLRTWHAGSAYVEDVTPLALLGGQVARKVFQTALPIDGIDSYFMRVRPVKQ